MKSLLFILFPFSLFAQQIADTSYQPTIENPMYESGQGSVIFIDEGHHNFHTKEGRYWAFANLLERDGYQVNAFKSSLTIDELAKGKILVISNALHEKNIDTWILPTYSAFSQEEISILEKWVNKGGSLFLIADHMPMAGAATDLAKVFGFDFTDGFALREGNGQDIFSLKENTLHQNQITIGRNESESVSEIITFTGQAFQIPEDAQSILTFNDEYRNLLPDTAWVFQEHTKSYTIEGWSQGAYKLHGNGKVVVFGEAAMFTAQLAGKQKAGMNHKKATQNYQLLLNIIHWLDGKLED